MSLRTLCIDIFACYVRINISYFFFPFYKTKKIEIDFVKFFKRQELRIFQRIPLKYYSVSRLNTSCQRFIFRLEYH